jgi:hypothetical protein
MRRYSEAVKADVRRRMHPPHRQSVARISEELGIHVMTLYKWRKASPVLVLPIRSALAPYLMAMPPYAFRGRDALAQDSTPDGSPLSDQAVVLCLAEFRDPAAGMASHRRGDGRSRPVPGTARHRGPVV